MERNRGPSEQAQRVIGILAERPTEWRYGYDLCRETGLKAGTMYPILVRLADRGWLATAWEDEVPEGRPRRHLYRLTKTGLAQARELAEAQVEKARARKAALRLQAGQAR